MWQTSPIIVVPATSCNGQLGNAQRFPDTAKRRFMVFPLGAFIEFLPVKIAAPRAKHEWMWDGGSFFVQHSARFDCGWFNKLGYNRKHGVQRGGLRREIAEEG